MESPPPYEPATTADFETSSMRSAAPSYTSDTPTYVSTPPPSHQIGLPPITTAPLPRHIGLPPIPPLPTPRTNPNPSFGSNWSRAQTSNPATKHYLRIAQRRASSLTVKEQSSLLIAVLNGDDAIAQIKKKMDDEQRARQIRTSEDPQLVGEQAAEENRKERLRRENGWDVLEREDQRWDWILAQMSDWKERDKSWKKYRKDIEAGSRKKLSSRFRMAG